MTRLLTLVVVLAALSAPAFADSYPVNGRFGVVTSFTDKPPDCTGKRVVAFNGNQRTDSKGGVPAYRNRSVQGRRRVALEGHRHLHHRADLERAGDLHAARGQGRPAGDEHAAGREPEAAEVQVGPLPSS